MRGNALRVTAFVVWCWAGCTRGQGSRSTHAQGASEGGDREIEVVAVAPTLPPPPPSTPPRVAGCQVFPADNPWNRDVSRDPVDPRSDEYIANIAAHGPMVLHADFGANPQYGIPYTIVPRSQPMVPVRFRLYPRESDPGPYPVPDNAPIEWGRDHHVIVLQEGTCKLYELYRAERRGRGWTAGSGAIFDLGSNDLRPNGWTSCDQAGLPIFPGLVRHNEVAEGAIHHAIRVTFNHTQNAWVSPARHPGDTDDRGAPPMGLRFRLKADYDITRFTGATRVILEALKRYGMLTADTGVNWYITGTPDLRWRPSELHALEEVPGTAFEVVQSGTLMRRTAAH